MCNSHDIGFLSYGNEQCHGGISHDKVHSDCCCGYSQEYIIHTQSLGHLGKVVKVLPSDDVQVAVAGRRWVFSPFCLKPAPGEQPNQESSECVNVV